jgi:hypothetical protein
MLALLLALSPVAVALQASAPAAPTPAERPSAVTGQPDGDATAPPENRTTTTVMGLGTDPARTAFYSPSLALGSSLTIAHDGFETQLGVESLDRELEAAETSPEKQRILNRFRYHIENRVISLKAKERQLTSAFSNRTISKSEYVRSLGLIDAEAAEIRDAITILNEYAKSTQLGIDAQALKAKLVTVEGPVRNRIAKTLQGDADPTRVYVATADAGIVLSTIAGGTYIREIYRSDNRDPSQQQSITVGEAMDDVIRPRYPWVSDTNHWTGSRTWGSRRRVFPPIQSIKYTYFHPHGRLTAYVDAGTAKVYREIQHKRLTGDQSLPPGPAVTNTTVSKFGQNLTLTVNRTYPGGPLRVKLTNVTGVPLQGRITVGGEPVGRTNENGVLWTLGPADQFVVNATHEGTSITVTTAPVESS